MQQSSDNKTVLYLRTDLGVEQLQAGGSVAHTLGIIKGLQSLNYRVIAASSAMVGIFDQLALPKFVHLSMRTLYSLVGFKVSCLVSNVVFFVSAIWRLRRQNIAVIYQRYSLLSVVGVLLSWWYRVPLVLEFNGSEVWVDKHWSKNRLLRMQWLIRVFELWNVRYAHTIVVVSDVLKETLLELGVAGTKIVVQPNGVDTQLFDPVYLVDERLGIRRLFGLDRHVVFGFIGTFSYWHGIEMLGNMIPDVVRRWPHARFVLIGDGPLRGMLHDTLQRQNVLDAVHFLGMVVQDQARAYLAACDAFLLPTQTNVDGTRFFGSPTKLFEYMSLEKPIIASDLEQIRQILAPSCANYGCSKKKFCVEHALGILVDPQDAAGFVAAAGLVIEQMQQTRCIGTRARMRVQSLYTWQHHTKKVFDAVWAQGRSNGSC